MLAKSVLLVNGSIGGQHGNTSHLLSIAADYLSPGIATRTLNLSEPPSHDQQIQMIEEASAFVWGTGTYWDSWGSPLQHFLEQMTPTEGTELWLGKPAAVLVSMHSVGGKSILSRLQGVLNTFGMLIPPMSGMVYSATSHELIKKLDSPLAEDLWQLSDIEVICHNLLEAISSTTNWKTWPVDRVHYQDRWIDEIQR